MENKIKNLTHTDESGKARIVDVSGKEATLRTARAFCKVIVSKEVFEAIFDNNVKKGDVLSVAKIAGIQAAKKTSDLIPLCHNIFISDIDINFEMDEPNLSISIYSTAKTNSVTGIEMEALTAVSIAALTIYDMCKGLDKSIIITEIKLLSKSGGKSGDYNLEN